MVMVMELLRRSNEPQYDFDDKERRNTQEAFDNGVDILNYRSLVTADTVWCAQHDETGFSPSGGVLMN